MLIDKVMKNILMIIALFASICIEAQYASSSLVNNQGDTFAALGSGNLNKYGATTRFVNPPKKVMGSVYLFDNWDSKGVLYTKTRNKYIVKNLNLNMQRNVFEARISKDTIFSYYFNNIDKFVINGKVYKSLFSEKGKRLYEIVYESDDFSIIKGFHIEYITGSVNPMLRRLNDKYVRVQTFYVKRNDEVIKRFRFNKKTVLKLLEDNPERNQKFMQYMEDNSFSFKKSDDVKSALIFSERI